MKWIRLKSKLPKESEEVIFSDGLEIALGYLYYEMPSRDKYHLILRSTSVFFKKPTMKNEPIFWCEYPKAPLNRKSHYTYTTTIGRYIGFKTAKEFEKGLPKLNKIIDKTKEKLEKKGIEIVKVEIISKRPIFNDPLGDYYSIGFRMEISGTNKQIGNLQEV